MRNIKTTLRLSRNSALLMAAATGALALTACSDEIVPGDKNGINEPEQKVESLNVTVNTDANSLSSLVKNYPNSRNVGTRAASDLEFPGMNTIPSSEELAAMTQITSESNMYYLTGYKGTPNFHVTGVPNAGITYNPTVVLEGTYNGEPLNQNPTYYLDGDLTIALGGQGTHVTLHVLPGANVKFTTNLLSDVTVYVHDDGVLSQASSSTNVIDIAGTYITDAKINLPDAELKVSGEFYSSASIKAKNITLNGGKVYAGCGVTASDTVYFTGKSEMSVGYVKANNIEFGSNQNMECLVRDGGYIEGTESIKVHNCDNTYIHAEDDDYALLKTSTLNCNSIDLCGTFQHLYIDYDTLTGDNRLPDEASFNNNCVINGSTEDLQLVKDNTTDACSPITVLPKPETNPDDNPIEDQGSIDVSHDHEISATCIFTNDNDAYASWHTRGEDIHGCVEHWSVANGEITLKAYLETPTIDFNHVIYADGRVLVAGDDSNGGIMGWINCDDGTFPSNNEATLYKRALYSYELNGKKYTSGSGNVILKNGNYYQTASIRGFESFVCDDLSKDTSFPAYGQLATYTFKDGSSTEDWSNHTGKHIATDGQKVVMLTLVDRNENNAKAGLKVFAASDYKFENCLASYTIESDLIAPVDGKNVVAIDGDDIFVCLGQSGVKHLKISGTTMTEVKSFKLSSLTKDELKAQYKLTVKQAAEAAANGLAIDKDQVYIAYGGAGMIVLNRSDFSRYAHVRHSAGKSANYVRLGNDGYIYVAYGLSKIQVYAKKL